MSSDIKKNSHTLFNYANASPSEDKKSSGVMRFCY